MHHASTNMNKQNKHEKKKKKKKNTSNSPFSFIRFSDYVICEKNIVNRKKDRNRKIPLSVIKKKKKKKKPKGTGTKHRPTDRTLMNNSPEKNESERWAATRQNQQKWPVRPAKAQISLSTRTVWSESSPCAQWVDKDPSCLHADSEDSDPTRRMPRLIWIFVGRTYHFIGFVIRRLI